MKFWKKGALPAGARRLTSLESNLRATIFTSAQPSGLLLHHPLGWLIASVAILSLAGCLTGAEVAPRLAGSGPGIYVRASGEGGSLEQAKDGAFRQAVEKAYGMVINSQQELRDDRIVQDRILSYSSGFVMSHDVLGSGEVSPGRYRVEIAALVSSSKIAERILNRPSARQATDVVGEQLYAQVSTLMTERTTGETLINAVLAEYPSGAFVIDVTPPTSFVDANRHAGLEFVAQVRWAKTYLIALEEAVQHVSGGRCWFAGHDHYNPRCKHSVKIARARDDGFFVAERLYGLPDTGQRRTVTEQLSKPVFLRISLRDSDDVELDQGCFESQLWRLVHTGSDIDVVINEFVSKRQLKMSVARVAVLRRLHRVEARITAQC